MYNSWKWSTGETYYKSTRLNKNVNSTQESNSHKNVIEQSLADYNQDSDLIDITNLMFSRNQDSTGTRREDIDTKMADREMISQRGVNPFLQTSYVNDIVMCDMFLKPINTTQGRTTVNSEE